MRGALKRLVIGSRWESPVRRLHHAVTGSRNSLYDVQTLEIMRRVLHPDSNAVDVGAFEGGMLRHMIRMAPRGKHIAVEPNPDLAASLGRNFPRVAVHACALADAPGPATFHRVLAHPALSGLRRRRDLPREERGVDIPVVKDTLDRIVPPELPLAFIKVDVEGAELAVFRGGDATLRRTRPVVVFECGLGGADTYGATPEQVFDTVTERIGLRISLLPDWLAARPGLTREQFVERFERSLDYYFVAHP